MIRKIHVKSATRYAHKGSKKCIYMQGVFLVNDEKPDIVDVIRLDT